MKASFVIIGVVMSVYAINTESSEKSLHAHEHGAIKVGMAIDNKTVEIDIDGPAESFLGFEYLPKTAKEKKIFSDLQAQWTKNLDSFIAFDKKLNCKVIEANFMQVSEGIHSDIEATAKLSCDQNLSGSDVVVSLRKVFKHIKKLSVEIISNETKTVEISKPIQTFKI